MSKKELIELGIRVGVTFVQGFFAVWAASGFKADKVVLGGAVASALSLAYNLVIKPYLESLKPIARA